MKIPYLKLYTADLLANSRHLTAEQIGQAMLGISEICFLGQTDYKPENQYAQAFWDMLLAWKDEGIDALKSQHKKAKNAAKARWAKRVVSDGATSISKGMLEDDTQVCHTETETETETDNKLLTSAPKSARKEPNPKRELNGLQKFSNAVIENFEPEVQTDGQKAVWFKRNCRCLSDILRFCGGDIDMALGCIYVCATRLKKANLRGGYEAVCRNLPDYYSEAKKLQEAPYAN